MKKENFNYRKTIRNSIFYKSIDNFAKDTFPDLKRILSEKLNIICQEKKFPKSLHFIDLYEIHKWEQCTQWILEIDFDDYEWSYDTMKPHFFVIIIMLEEVVGKKELYFSCSFSNSFSNFSTKINIKITEKEINNNEFISYKINEMKSFFNSLNKEVLREMNKIEYDKLELQ